MVLARSPYRTVHNNGQLTRTQDIELLQIEKANGPNAPTHFRDQALVRTIQIRQVHVCIPNSCAITFRDLTFIRPIPVPYPFFTHSWICSGWVERGTHNILPTRAYGAVVDQVA